MQTQAGTQIGPKTREKLTLGPKGAHGTVGSALHGEEEWRWS